MFIVKDRQNRQLPITINQSVATVSRSATALTVDLQRNLLAKKSTFNGRQHRTGLNWLLLTTD